jgi:hypothetical protein
MTATPTERPYDNLVNAAELARLEKVVPGAGDRILTMIETDMKWIADRVVKEDARQHNTRLLCIWLTVGVIVLITAASVLVILAGHDIAGSILATADLVALVNVVINSWRRGDIGQVPPIPASAPNEPPPVRSEAVA